MQLINPIKLCEYANNFKDKQIDANDIMRFPTIDAEPVRHGTWVETVERVDALGGYWIDVKHTECSECHVWALRDCYGQTAKSNYCPNCGARMDLGKVGE